jgi:predicted component of type VI protein secretion system
MINTPKLRVPFEIDGDRALTVGQDTDEEIQQCVIAILRTRIGSRSDLPDMGIPDFAFRQNGADLHTISAAIEEYEPRAGFTSFQELEDFLDTVHIDLESERSSIG